MTKKRPVLSNLINTSTLEIEHFQNSTVRPIIKMQHDILNSLFFNSLNSKRIDISNLSDSKKKELIRNIITKDNGLKKFFLGVIIGHFSNKELTFYFKFSREINKRIIQIIIQRLQS